MLIVNLSVSPKKFKLVREFSLKINGINKMEVNCLSKDFHKHWLRMQIYQQSQKEQSGKPNNQSN